MVDKSLNYGRHNIRGFLQNIGSFQSVLDLGAGQGDDLMIAKEIAPSARLYALEGYPPYVDILTRQGIEVFNFDLERERFPFEDESLDVIMVNQVMEHVKDVYWILHEVSRVLKKGGHFIVGVPNLASLHNRFMLLLGRQPSTIRNDSAHVRGYTKGDFMNLMNSGFPNGYELAAFKGSNFYPFPPFLAKPLAEMLPSMGVGIFMSLRKTRSYEGRGYLVYPIEQRLETKFYLG